jgi:NAD(P)-dependent dehydrogenase (short-subunit alcohol dehydrogenase family)
MASTLPRAIAIEGDVSAEHDAMRAVATTVAELSTLDVLINKAGIELTGMWSSSPRRLGPADRGEFARHISDVELCDPEDAAERRRDRQYLLLKGSIKNGDNLRGKALFASGGTILAPSSSKAR